MSNKVERRLITKEFRAVKSDGQPTKLVGYAAVYNSDSEDLGGFVEQIAPGAFTDVLAAGPDCRCLLNHDPSLLLGRTKSGTLSLSEDNIGLLYECIAPDTSTGRDVLVLADRGDINQSSFGFRVDPAPGSEAWFDASGKQVDNWSYSGVKRIIYKIAELVDCSPVTYPAYPASSVEARSKFLFPDGAPERRQKDAAPAAKDEPLSTPDKRDVDSLEDQISEVQTALSKQYPGTDACWGGQYWTVETYDDSVIVCESATGNYFSMTYSEPTEGSFVFGAPVAVEQTWTPAARYAVVVAERRAAIVKAATPEVVAPVPAEKRTNDDGCDCDCPECVANDCAECSDPNCEDEDCVSSDAYLSRSLVTRLNLAAAQNS